MAEGEGPFMAPKYVAEIPASLIVCRGQVYQLPADIQASAVTAVSVAGPRVQAA